MSMYKRMDYRVLVAALIFLAGLIFLVIVGSAAAQGAVTI
jgi:hypothetical protein